MHIASALSQSETMRVLVATAFAALAASSCASSVGPWMKTEKTIAKANLLANIGSSGSRAPGAFVCISVSGIENPITDDDLIARNGRCISLHS
jgi:hypothetical protein